MLVIHASTSWSTEVNNQIKPAHYKKLFNLFDNIYSTEDEDTLISHCRQLGEYIQDVKIPKDEVEQCITHYLEQSTKTSFNFDRDYLIMLSLLKERTPDTEKKEEAVKTLTALMYAINLICDDRVVQLRTLEK